MSVCVSVRARNQRGSTGIIVMAAVSYAPIFREGQRPELCPHAAFPARSICREGQRPELCPHAAFPARSICREGQRPEHCPHSAFRLRTAAAAPPSLASKIRWFVRFASFFGSHVTFFFFGAKNDLPCDSPARATAIFFKEFG